LRGLARATDFVDAPAQRKSHDTSIPYLGGVGLIAGLLVGLAFAPSLSPPIKVIALGGPVIGMLGLLDDHRTLNPYLRFAVEMGVAVLALASGLRIHATDVALIDGFLTLIWIVGITNAVNFLDNMDGLSAGVAAAGGLGILTLAILGEQVAAAVVAAGLVGACLGFLVYNRRPASIFMGDTGSLFLGFVLAVMAIEVSPTLALPASFAVPVILLALPVLDTSTVMLARMRRGRSVLLGGRDHLSHRLAKLGLSSGTAVWVLIVIELVVAALSVLAGREAIPLAAAIGGTVVVLATLSAVTARAQVYEEDVVGLPRKVRMAAFACTGALVVLTVPTLVALVRSTGPAQAGTRAVRDGLAALAADDGVRAAALFTRAGSDFERAGRVLDGRVTSLSAPLPIVRSNLSASRAVVATGRVLAGDAARIAAFAEAANVRLAGGADVAGEARKLSPDLAGSASVLHGLAVGLQGLDRPYLWPSLKRGLRELRTGLSLQAAAAEQAAETARVLPGLLGADGARRYFIAVQDNGELRGTGGVIRAWAEVVAQDGRLRLTRVGSLDDLNRNHEAGQRLDAPEGFLDRYREFGVADTWQNVNVSPDFSVTGQVISTLYAQSGGQALDGVVAVDLQGLAAVLSITGPLAVDGQLQPVTADSARGLTTATGPNGFTAPSNRQAFFTDLTRTTVEAFIRADKGTPRQLAKSLREVVADKHLLLYSRGTAEQALFERIGAAGILRPPAADSLLVVNQNLTATSIDVFLRRQVSYAVELDPARRPATVTGRVGVTLRNDAPLAAGPQRGDASVSPGDNRTYLSVYTPSALDNGPHDVQSDRELGRRSYSTILTLAPQQARTIDFDISGKVALVGGWYTLDLPRQASLSLDETSVSLTVPGGWRIDEARGMHIQDSRHAVANLVAANERQLAVRVERTPWASLWYRGRP